MPTTDTLSDKIRRELTELTDAVNSIVETFRSMQSPLMETRKKVPQATNQLDKISEQTEAATHQVLDRVEQITQRESDIIADLEQLKQNAPDGGGETVASMITNANANLEDAYMIMDALQFQDITAQQMNHAASLLEEIEGKLQRIVGALAGERSTGDAEAKRQTRLRVFDPNADLFDKKTDQADIDELFGSAKTD